MITIEAFTDICAQQNTSLYFPVALEGDPGQFPVESYEPSAILAAIVQAGRFLRKHPGEPLADHTVHPPTQAISEDIAFTTLATMLNDSLYAASDPTMFQYTSSGDFNIDACAYAETGFALTAKALKKPWAMPDFMSVDIVVDAEAKPLFLRKGEGVPSALALQPFAVNGIRFPAGSLARVELLSDILDLDRGITYLDAPFDEVVIRDASTITNLSFKRLSAFAFPGGERRDFRQPLHNIPADVRRIVKWTPLSAISELAVKASEYAKSLATAA